MQKTKSPGSARLHDLNTSKLIFQKNFVNELVDHTPIMIWLSGVDQQHYFFSDNWLQFTGRTIEQEKGMGWTAGIHPEDLPGYLVTYTQCFQVHKIFQMECRLMQYDGIYHWMLNIGKPNFVNGVFTGFVGFCIDIQDQKEVTQVLKDTIQNIQMIIDSLPNLAWRNDNSGKAVYCNPNWMALTGQSTAELVKHGPREFVHPDDYVKVDVLWSKHSKSGQPLETEIRYLRAIDKSYRWHLVRAVPIKNNDGKLISWISTGTDIHEQKQFAVELEQHVADRTKDLINANLNLKRSNHDLQQFAYAASHDLQEPLRKIILYTDRLLNEYYHEMPLKAKDHMNRVLYSARRTTQMITDLMTFTELANKENDFVKTDLKDILKEVYKSLGEIIKSKNAKIKIGNLPVIDAIPDQMNILFFHLISNSLKFCANDVEPIISINSRTLSDLEVSQHDSFNVNSVYCEISVLDNGIGFDQEVSEQLFTIFQRLHGKSEFQGTGIGLSLCRKIVQKHNGVIYSRSEINKGSGFYILLPLVQDSSAQHYIF